MRIAISIPDPIYQAAEEIAARLGLSRSQFYARAVASFVERHTRPAATEQLNAVHGRAGSRTDPVLARMQFSSLPKEEW